MPLCGGDILQSPAKPCPMFRRGRCSHRPGNPAMSLTPSGGRERPPYKALVNGQQYKKQQPFVRPDGGPMISSAPTQRGGTPQPSSTHHARPPRLCRPFALHCRAGRSRPPRGAAARKDIGRARHRTPPSSLTRCHLPLQGRLLERQALYKASPAKGCGVERRLRRRKRDGAGLTVAEHKRASARAVRCGHRKPDGGCAARRRRKGALPRSFTGILQSPAGPCPASVGDEACIVPETLPCRRAQAAGEIARPTRHPQAGGDTKSGSPLPSLRALRW